MATIQYSISGIDCPSCAEGITNVTRSVPGVEALELNSATSTLAVSGDYSEQVLKQRLARIGHQLTVPQIAAAPAARGGVLGFVSYLGKQPDTRFLLAGSGLIVVALFLMWLQAAALVVEELLIGALAIAVWPIARSGVSALLYTRSWTINLLMSVAALGAVAIGEYLEAATVVILFGIGEALEGYTSERSRASIRSLLDLTPPQALRVDGTEQISVLVSDLGPGDVVLVQPGERIPVDGVVLRGISAVDQAPITGESVPVTKAVDDPVWAGTINGDGALYLEVSSVGADTTLQRIIHLVEAAQERRSATQRTIERFAAWYTPAIMVLALLFATLPPLLGLGPWLDTPTTHGWLYRALSLLVIACPCALVISAPVTIISGMTAAARQGVLIKGGRALEALSGLRAIAFDKTGTLTYGTPTLISSRSLICNGEMCSACDDVLALAAAVERQSAHPLARAITKAAEQRQLRDVYAPAEQVVTLVGQGVQGRIGERTISIGNHAWFETTQPHAADICKLVQQQEAAGHTTMLLGDGTQVQGLIAVADTVREQSSAAVAALNALGLTTVMLTGDNATVAQAVGQQVGVADVRAGLLPADKLHAIDALAAQHGAVAMVGDGINDTPALAAATVGIAVGGASSAQAVETADVVLMAPHLERLPFVIRLARRVQGLIKQNIVLSLVTKLIFVVLALLGMTSLWVAIIADVGMTLLVTLNGMRPLRQA